MKIRTRIALFYTLITTVLIMLFGVIIYWNAASNREKSFFNLLQNEAVTKANLYFHTEVDEATLQKIYLNNKALIDEVEVAIYHPPFELIYHDAVEIDVVQETPEMITEVLEKGILRFYQDDWQVIGIPYVFQNQKKIVFAAAKDVYGISKLAALRSNMIVVFLLGIVVLYFAGVFIAKKAFDPIKEMTIQANKISAANLNLRLAISKNKDELTDLSKTFNAMLNRLEKSFDAQKDFVSNIAHEIRTPLSAIIGELELALLNNRGNKSIVEAINSTLLDAQRLAKIASSLMDLAKANYDTDRIKYSSVRLDEILLDACKEVQKINKDYLAEISFQLDGDTDFEELLTIQGNEYLLKLAFFNIIENACKYADDMRCRVEISTHNKRIALSFIDNGCGILEKDLPLLTKPFFRAQNSKSKGGAGVGLSLVERILELHKGKLEITSAVNKGTKVRILF